MYYHINHSINKDTKNKITVSHHTQEHTDVKYNIGVYVYVYHPVLILHFQSVISTVTIIPEEKRIYIYLLVLVRYFNLLNLIF